MTTINHQILLKAETKSKAKILGKHLKSFVAGQEFVVTYKLTNNAKTVFPGGTFRVNIAYPIGQTVWEDYVIPKLDPNETYTTPIFITEALASGYALFVLTKVRSNDTKPVDWLKSPGEALALEPNSFYSIQAKEPEEIYEFWGMLISAFSLLSLLAIEIIRFIFYT